jgi:hypothetical protein
MEKPLKMCQPCSWQTFILLGVQDAITSNNPFYPFLIINFYWHSAFRKNPLLKKEGMMKKFTMFVAGLVFITLLVSFYSYQSLEPKNVFAKDVVGDEQVIKDAYIDGFMDALMLGQDQINNLQNNREAMQREAITAADLYYKRLKLEKQ